MTNANDTDLVESETPSRNNHTTVGCGVSTVDLRPQITPDAVLEVVSQSHRQRLSRHTELARVTSIAASTPTHTAQPILYSGGAGQTKRETLGIIGTVWFLFCLCHPTASAKACFRAVRHPRSSGQILLPR